MLTTLLSGATAAVTGTAVKVERSRRSSGGEAQSPCTFQATGSVTASTGAVTVYIEVSNDGVNFLTPELAKIDLVLGTTAVTEGFSTDDQQWGYVRARIPAAGISGTNATVTVTMSF